jgi:hypothetical protein
MPTPYTSPSYEYEASHMLKKLGLAYNVIDVFIKGCVLFRGVHANVDHCVHCGGPCYRWARNSKVARKVFRHFPLAPQLTRMYNTLDQAKLMVWHHHNHNQYGLVRHATNSHQWNFVEARWLDFTMEPRNVWLGLTMDGVNSFGFQRSNWFTWPMVMLNYNISPWLTTKKHFVMLSLIIPGLRFYKE